MTTPAAQPSWIIIAHRGASGYLPEHTLPAKALAWGMGADYLEQDVVLTRDGEPIVLHDIHLDTVTDVARRFPSRHREDGRFYALDFTWQEVQSLRVKERIDLKTGQAVFPGRFPTDGGSFQLVSLAQELEFIQGLQRSTERTIGIYPEIKSPDWHRQQGHDISRIVLETLQRFGYTQPDQAVFVQCFDPLELQRLRSELGTRLPLIQLTAEDRPGAPPLYEPLLTPSGLARLAQTVQGIGPSIGQVLRPALETERDPALRAHDGGEQRAPAVATTLVRDAQRAGLLVHPYTVRRDALPAGLQNHDLLLEQLISVAGVDGLFTDFPDLAAQWRRSHN